MQCRLFLGQWVPGVFVPAVFVLFVAASIAFSALGQLVGLLGHRFGGRGWLGGLVGLLALIVAAGLAVAFGALFCAAGHGAAVFRPRPNMAAVGASVLGALVVCGAVQAASWLILRRICVK